MGKCMSGRMRVFHRKWPLVALALAALASGLLASRDTQAQDQSAATAKDVIFARKTVMDSLSDKMDQIESMNQTGKVNVDAAHDLADTISVMLMAFPHLFPPSSNQWKPNNK